MMTGQEAPVNSSTGIENAARDTSESGNEKHFTLRPMPHERRATNNE